MDKLNSTSRISICSRHFVGGERAHPMAEGEPDWAPSINLGVNEALNQEDGLVDIAVPERDPPPNQVDGLVDMAEPECDTPAENFPGDAESVEDPLAVDETCDASACVEPDSEDEFMEDNFEDFGMNTNIVNSTIVSDEAGIRLGELQAEYDSLGKSHYSLRNSLTETEVDKLELSQALRSLQAKCEQHDEKFEALKRETAELRQEKEQTQARMNMIENETELLKTRINVLEYDLAKATRCVMTLERLQSDDAFVTYFTGLPSYGIFNAVLTLVTSQISDTTRCLESWQCLLLTLMRLRLGLQFGDLAHRFGISNSAACCIFEKWLFYLYIYLEPCVTWPDRETLYKTMPVTFKAEFGKSVAVIIDCFELFCERPSALDSRAMTWSNYKHHNTVKFLIGITPLGAVSFISQGWGGRVSDEHITANSGLYNKLLPNDVILADRGFTISEDVGFYCARVLIPAFTRGQAQLSAHDITDTRRLAALRVHVERVIGLVKNKYRILKTTLHRDLLTVKPGHEVAQIDEIVRVCCALTNLSPCDFV